MKFLTFKKGGFLKLGIKTDLGVLDIEKAGASFQTELPTKIEDVINKKATSLEDLDAVKKQALESKNCELFLEEEEFTFGPAVTKPGKIICVGLNYKKHALESNMPLPEYPILFNKFDNTISAHNQVINLPFNSTENDYEAELAIVIGKEAKRVSTDEALDYVFGYCNANDLSSRDLQFRTNQWLLGKCCDGFSPLGPYLVTSDEIGDPNQLQIKATVNGEVRQHSNTSDMIFKCNEIISYISDHMTLRPGDVILTGTPEGVALGLPEGERVYLQNGDEVTIEIEKLGTLTNKFKQEV
ncbi:fumarylacetoacetate hydrolase family protein [Desertibacillus haloalkaliphilus]|uniref:fumarylacetoacetate hydrolase family protein n=1 Tax=Desertibacillus haloalkaliphilus TaxID=1328930 RepID=UPI001C272ABC|nr:fumarylacetoacetate hydrolase family protein [Desertibacillus haloalkaliphilus]MBU8908197.1 fumarylacetoacetate hydrolase family protein [Desertibacillus haloalkaliphilus]